MSKIVIVGAGASGILSALNISDNNEIILLDGNDKCGKKILLTGNGRCNYWNENINTSKYNTDNIDYLSKIISKDNQKDVLNYFDSIGIYPKIKSGYYYPYSNQASSIRTILLNEIERKNIRIINNFKVGDIEYNNNKFLIKSTNNEIIEADKVILSTGSKAYPKTGSDGSGYNLAQRLGHKVNDITPALTPLISDYKYLKEWAGVRSDATISLYIDNELVKQETGEIQLTNYGISGICTFNISSIASKNLKKQVYVTINFLPDIDTFNFLEIRNKSIPNHTISELLESLINYKLMYVILKEANINKDSKWDELDKNQKQKLCNTISNFKLNIVDVGDFEKCQVCTGGVSLSCINPNTMESKIVPNLYLVGELLDVDGVCGGYNLAFAWISGMIAGKNI